MDPESRTDIKTADSSIGDFLRNISRFILSAVAFGHEECDRPGSCDVTVDSEERNGHEGNDKRDPVSDRGRESRSSGHDPDAEGICNSGVQGAGENKPATEFDSVISSANDSAYGRINSSGIGTDPSLAATNSSNSGSLSTGDRRVSENNSDTEPTGVQHSSDDRAREHSDSQSGKDVNGPGVSGPQRDQASALVQESPGLRLGANQASFAIREVDHEAVWKWIKES